MHKRNRMSGESFESLLFNLRSELEELEQRYKRSGEVTNLMTRTLENVLRKYARVTEDFGNGFFGENAEIYEIEQCADVVFTSSKDRFINKL